jgi:hypothetical protein
MRQPAAQNNQEDFSFCRINALHRLRGCRELTGGMHLNPGPVSARNQESLSWSHTRFVWEVLALRFESNRKGRVGLVVSGRIGRLELLLWFGALQRKHHVAIFPIACMNRGT